MSRLEYRAVRSVRHEYLLPIPCNFNEMNSMLEQARNDREAAGLEIGNDDDLLIASDDHSLFGYWEQTTDIPAQGAFAGPESEILAKALCAAAQHDWEQIPEVGREQYRNNAMKVLEEMNRAV